LAPAEGDWIGKKNIHESYAKFRAGEGHAHEIMHEATHPWTRFVDDESANGPWYLLDLHTTETAENPLMLFGIYDDVYKKVDGR